MSRLSQIVQNPAGTSHDLTLGFTHNPAHQIVTNGRSNDSFAWTGHGSGTSTYTVNGLNQLTSLNATLVGHDAKGNVTSDPTNGLGYGYSSENLLTTVSGGAWTGTLVYDPLMRLYQAGAGGVTRSLYDGFDRIADHNGAGTQTARYVHGPNVDEPLIVYDGTGLATRKFLHADERGSIVASSNDSGTVTAIGKYDDYGKPQSCRPVRLCRTALRDHLRPVIQPRTHVQSAPGPFHAAGPDRAR